MTSIKSTTSTSTFVEQELLPKGLYTLTMKVVGEIRESTLPEKNGRKPDDYTYITFEAEDDNGEFVGEFDSMYPFVMWVQMEEDGKTRKKVARLQEMAEAFLDREIEDGEEINFESDIIRPRRKARATVIVAKSQDGKKTFNKIESILPMPRKRRQAPAAADANDFDQLAAENGHEVVGGVVQARR